MRLRCVIILTLLVFPIAIVMGQQRSVVTRIMWWNLENFFDPSNDSLTADDDFTAEGENHWTYRRFYQKKDNIYKAILSMGLDSLPVAIGICEVENDWVLRQLCLNTPLRRFDYDYIHYDSPDRRGIDVALLYRKNLFEVIYSKPIPVVDVTDTDFKTRDILLVKGVIKDMDTVFFLMNHFPSKRLGYVSYKKRMLAVTVLGNTLDTIVQSNPNCKMVVMGDFNDTPFDDCIVKGLQVLPDKKDWGNNTMINLMVDVPLGKGTYKYQGWWSCIDQIMITKNLYPDYSTSMEVVGGIANIYSPNFLLIRDNKFLGMKLYRTYTGPKYHGGFSDHLPIYIDIQKTNK